MGGPLLRWWWGRFRTIRPTREGWWCLVAATGLGVAAVNTGNNLAYLLCSILLSIITVSGALSDLTLRGLRLRVLQPDEVYAGRAALFGVVLVNRKRWLATHSIDVVTPGGTPGVLHVARLGPASERLGSVEVRLPRRGRHRLPPFQLATRFPFGLFLKSWPATAETEVLVYPATGPLSRQREREIGAAGEATTRRRGRGHELYNLRPYRPGDEPRLIHWPTTARAGVVTVRELEEDAALDTRIVLAGTGARNPDRLEAGLSEAASLAVHLLRGGVAVELVGPGIRVPLGRGRGQEAPLLTALALYAPPVAAPGPGARPPALPPLPGGLRQIVVGLD
jgi:uncharacterized protein (DUF58 family)